jgi:hypothetical protein
VLVCPNAERSLVNETSALDRGLHTSDHGAHDDICGIKLHGFEFDQCYLSCK